MSTRRNLRRAARCRATAARRFTPYSLYRRALRIEPLEDRRLLAVVTVNTLSDTTNLNDNLTTLREAIFATNLVPGADTIDFAPALTANGPATIVLTQGELKITDSLTVNGPGANLLTIDASGSDPTPGVVNGDGSRVFNIDDGVGTASIVSISGLKLTGGEVATNGGAIFTRESLSLVEMTIDKNFSTSTSSVGAGGGVAAALNNGAALTISHSLISHNQSTARGGGISLDIGFGGTALVSNSQIIGNSKWLPSSQATSYAGGGIYISNPFARAVVTIEDSDVIGNLSDGGGGGISFSGPITINSSTIAANSSLGSGGGIQFQGSSTLSKGLTLVDSQVTDNRGGDGGGIAFAGFGGQSTIIHSSINRNRAERTSTQNGFGGGVYADRVALNVVDSTISENVAERDGGGTFAFSTLTLIERTTVNNNVAVNGGGLSLPGGGTIRESTLTGNSAKAGGALYAGGVGGPGGVPTITISRSSIVRNEATINAGGTYTPGSRVNLDHSIVAQNASPSTSDDLLRGPDWEITAAFSLIGDNNGSGLTEARVGAPDANGNLIGGAIHGIIDPLLGALADNGGPTFTHALLPDSPAINAGDLSALAGVNGVPGFDQRGTPFGRVFNGRIDIGAFEYQQASDLNLLVDTLVDENDGNYARGDLSLREALALANMWPSVDTFHFDSALTAGGPAKILLTQGELKITDSLTISGPGAGLLTIDGSANASSRIFNVDDGLALNLDVSISGLTLRGSRTTAEGGAVFTRESLKLIDITADQNGNAGAIRAILGDGANLKILHSIVSNNFGGGLSISTSKTSAVQIEHTQILGNTTTGSGGGILIGDNLGNVSINDSVIRENSSTAAPGTGTLGGGGIASTGSGNLSISGTLIENNSSRRGGGGIHFRQFGVGGALNLSDSELKNNEADYGGGISIESQIQTATNTIVNCEISGNVVKRLSSSSEVGRGGGIHVGQATLYVSDLVISDNSAQSGGGIFIGSGNTFLMEGCSVINNVASSSGGGLATARVGTIRQSTFSGNTAQTGGGVSAGSLVIESSTITRNSGSVSGGGVSFSGGVISVDQSIIADNFSSSTRKDIGRGTSGVVAASFSIIGDNAGSGLAESPVGSTDGKGNRIGGPQQGRIDPLLRPLADYGGKLPTHALAPGSPAINAGNPAAAAGIAGVPLYDLRGQPYSRVVGGRIDIGAFEFGPIPGSSLTVDILADEADDNYSAGDLSLREALILANLAPDTNTIQFAPALTANGPATILLSQGALEIVGDVTIIGPGANLLTIDASGNDPTPSIADGLGSSIFEIRDDTDDLVDVSISGLTLTGGDSQYGGAILSTENLTITGSTITGNHAAQLGGGVAVLYGNVELTNCIISENSSDGTGGGIDASSAELVVEGCTIDGNLAAVGGGIHAYDTQLSVSNSSVDNNEAIGGGGAGGGIYQKDGKLTLADSTVSGNTSISGGGVYVDGEAEIVRSTLDGNYSYLHGGGIYAFGKLVVRETTISGSSTGLDGAGIHAAGDVLIDSSTLTANDAGRFGGAIWVEVVDGTLKIINSTISGNHADNEGGGVWITGVDATATIAHSTIVQNSANHLFGFGGGVVLNSGSLQLDQTIVATNSAKTGPDLFSQSGTQLATKYSLIGNVQDTSLAESPVGLPDANGNLIGGPIHGLIDPLLGALADNGGLTFTHALIAGSPAINAGGFSFFGIPKFDQRGIPFGRVGRVDIGAFEYQLTSNLNLVVDTLVDENDGDYSHGDLSLREAIALADVWPNEDTIHFDPELIASGPATITLTRGELKITTSISIVGLGADVLTIDASGNDPTPTIKDGRGSRIISISSYVFLSGMTLTGGDVATKGGAVLSTNAVGTLEDMRITGNSSLDVGGGISASGGRLAISRGAIDNNRASTGGGGILASTDNLVIRDSKITGNVLSSDKGIGGGINFGGGMFELTNSTVANNAAPLVGGGLATGGTCQITNSEISGNTSLSELGPRGAGLYLFRNTVANNATTIESSRIHNNSVSSIGRGGGIYSTTNLRLYNTTVDSNFGGVDGGGILSVGNLWLNDSTVTQNVTVNSAGGGGISMTSVYYVQVTGSTISNNQGSGIRQTVGYMSIYTSTISGNLTNGSGGGIYTGDSVTNIFISQSEIRNNHAAGSGGGIYKSSGELVVFDSTIDSNTAGGNGGGVASLANEDSYTSSTISGNEAAINGGGVWAGAGQTFAYSTIALNKASGTGGGAFLASGNTVAKNTIVARNTASSGIDVSGLLATHFEVRFSLIGSNQGSGLAPAPVGSPDSNGNLIGGTNANDFIDPKLAPLAKNGGLTRTQLPLAGSPAINAGDPLAFGAPTSDQRGVKFSRVVDGRMDIGAVELQPAPLLGDYNLNGIVDSGDYVVWRNTQGTSSSLAADGNDDGRVDNADYQIWRANFGNTRLGIGAATDSQPIAAAVSTALNTSLTTTANGESRLARISAPQQLPQLVASPDAKHRRPIVLAEVALERRAGGLLAWLADRDAAPKTHQSASERVSPSRTGTECAEADFETEAVDEAFTMLLNRAW